MMASLMGRIGRIARLGAWGAPLAALLAAGCAGSSPLARQSVEPYTPRVVAVERMPWFAGAEPVTGSAIPLPMPGTDLAQMPGPGETSSGGPVRTLRRDDRVMISMRGIPRPEELVDVVDSEGKIKLPYIGGVHVEGMTTSQAEDTLERAFVDGGFFRSIDVILVAQEESFFVRGEVARPGKYVLTGDTSLLMAISAAGGYTDFANPRRIRVLRGQEVVNLNAENIERLRDQNFLIEPNDIIIVERRIF